MNYEFYSEQNIDNNFLKNILESHKFPNLTNKLKSDMNNKKVELNIANMIKLYMGLNLNQIKLNEDNIIEPVAKMMSNLKYNKVNIIKTG